jgi:hypothetical protein
MLLAIILSLLSLSSFVFSIPCNGNNINPVIDPVIELNGEVASRYPVGTSCDTGGSYSTNEYGANICEYPSTICTMTKYFSYPSGGNGVELCCISNSDCNYNPVKNYCLPGASRCTDGSYFGCSEKAGPIFDSCL